MLGLGESHGTLSVGKRADFLVFDGEPFAPRTSIVKVAVAGVMIYESENQP
jgi:imidazolonepropionase-like amidohydrolase